METVRLVRDDVLKTVVELIADVLGDDWDPDCPIDEQTTFNDDLELESIEFVALAEKLEAQYAGRVDFVTWLSEKPLNAIIALSVGDLVEFIMTALGDTSG